MNRGVAVLLIVQLTLGSWVSVWAQGGGAGRGRGSDASSGRGATMGKTQKSGKGGGRQEGTESAQPAIDKLPGGRALSRAVVPDQYVVGPGDGLAVNIWGEFEDLYDLRVTPDGKINLPTVGDLKVKGLTLVQLETLLESEIKRYYRNVRVGVSLTSLRVFEVSVLGSVRSPGTYLSTPVRRVSDLVSDAGGVVPGGTSRHIELRRDGKVVAKADLLSYLRRGEESANPYVMDGDVIFVPTMRDRIVSLIINEVVVSEQTGQVTENSLPSTVELKEGERMSDLFADLQSTSPWWNLEGIYVVRETKAPAGTMKIPVDARRLLYDQDESQNIELADGDQVFIPSNVRRVFVNGMVGKGGAFAYVPNRTAEEYLGLAGGVTLQASLDRSTIRRADGTIEPFQPGAVLFSGDAIQVEQRYLATPADYIGIVGGITSLVFSAFALFTALK